MKSGYPQVTLSPKEVIKVIDQFLDICTSMELGGNLEFGNSSESRHKSKSKSEDESLERIRLRRFGLRCYRRCRRDTDRPWADNIKPQVSLA